MVFAMTGKLLPELLLRRLDLAGGVDRSGNQSMAPRRDVAPIVRPKQPGEPIAAIIDSGGSPGPVVNPDFHFIDRPRASPSGSGDPVLESVLGPPARHPGDHRF